MNGRAEKAAYAIAVVGGAALWIATAKVSGQVEAWEDSLYWSVAYPLSIALAGSLGYSVLRKPWRWGLAVMLAQAFVHALTTSSLVLLPLGLTMFGVLALPAMGAALIMAALRKRRGGRR